MNEGESKNGWSRFAIYIIFGLVIALGVYYFIVNRKSNPSQNIVSQSPNISTEIPQSVNQPVITISIENFQFNPSSVTVKKGSSITWVNRDSVDHTVTSDIGSELSSDRLGRGVSFNHVFNETGTFSYHCGIHRSMQGNIIVTD